MFLSNIEKMPNMRGASHRHHAHLPSQHGTQCCPQVVQYGVAIQTISAHSEAVFVYNGAMLSATSRVAPALCVDMGGGSTEVCVGHSGRPTAVCCISLGSSKLVNQMPKLLEEGVADRSEMLECMWRVREYLQRTDTSPVRNELVRSPLSVLARSLPPFSAV